MESSGIRKVFDLAAGLERPVNLSIGQPHYGVPDGLMEAACAHIRGGRNSYAPTAGLPELHAALRGHLQRRYAYEPEGLLVTAGVSGGLALAFLALLDPGDEILIPDPYFVSYKQLAFMVGARPVFYDTYPAWRPDVAKVERLITERTRVLLLNSPANPTGAVLPEDCLREMAGLAARHDLTIISDEIYDDFRYDGAGRITCGALHPRTVVLNGFSKSLAMTGWRVGWAAGPADIVESMTKIQQFTYVTVPPPFQLAAAAALESAGPLAAGHLEEYHAKRDLLCSLLGGRMELQRPGGAFYVFPRAPWGTGDEFAAAVVARGVLVIPGSVFSESDSHFRVSFAATDEDIRRGAEVLCELAVRGKP
jgi:aspartate aminotransferase/aminotransferase